MRRNKPSKPTDLPPTPPKSQPRMIEYEVGQTIYYVPSRAYSARPVFGTYVTVDKIGRKWVYLSNNHRVQKNTTYVDGNGYSSPGSLYLTKEEYQHKVELVRIISRINQQTQFNSTINTTLDNARKAAALLNVDLEERTNG